MIIALQLGDVKDSHDLYRSNSSGCWEQQLQVFLVPGTGFVEDNFPMDQSWGMALGWQVRYFYCAHYFYYRCISSSSDHQVLDPRGWEPLV